MYHSYAISHEKFVWDARLEPGVLDAFSKIWGTDDLLVSFDGINSVFIPASPPSKLTTLQSLSRSPNPRDQKEAAGPTKTNLL
jgi:hypothetical protein